jgi:hypothetical protein
MNSERRAYVDINCNICILNQDHHNMILFQIPASQGDSAVADGTANGVNPAGGHMQTQQG